MQWLKTAASMTILLDNHNVVFRSYIRLTNTPKSLCNVGFYSAYPGATQRGAHLVANHVFTCTRLMPK